LEDNVNILTTWRYGKVMPEHGKVMSGHGKVMSGHWKQKKWEHEYQRYGH